MSFDFSIDAKVEQARRRIAELIRDEVIPLEQRAFRDGLDDDLRRQLQQAGREAGVWAPQVPTAYGGGGFSFTECAVLLEESGYSLLGPLAMNCSAPDEGNIALLDEVATPEQQARFLRPLAAGDVRSCFAMTEPPPGAGSDPAALTTSAVKVPGGWVINGRKHLITGADGAAFAIVMARNDIGDPAGSAGSGDSISSGDSGSSGAATMFLVDADNPGWQVGEHARTIDASTVGGHCEVELHDVFVADDAVLGEVGRGFANAQVRLAPARLTHCMRWLGAARRAHDIALSRATTRELFGSRLSDLGMAQQMVADNEIDLAASRALLWQACWQLESGQRGTEESSRAKVFVSEAVGRVVDRSVQLAGGLGLSEELVLGRIYADVRAFRIYDGASEVHRMSIARRAARRAADRAQP